MFPDQDADIAAFFREIKFRQHDDADSLSEFLGHDGESVLDEVAAEKIEAERAESFSEKAEQKAELVKSAAAAILRRPAKMGGLELPNILIVEIAIEAPAIPGPDFSQHEGCAFEPWQRR
jgi:hypothetical protein